MNSFLKMQIFFTKTSRNLRNSFEEEWVCRGRKGISSCIGRSGDSLSLFPFWLCIRRQGKR